MRAIGSPRRVGGPSQGPRTFRMSLERRSLGVRRANAEWWSGGQGKSVSKEGVILCVRQRGLVG